MSPTTELYVFPALALAAISHGRWHPGIGDPTAMGWFTTASYLAAAILCLRRARISDLDPALQGKPFWFWTVCGVIMLLLCINKQLDLQQFFTQTGRDLARSEGWYGERRVVQSLFVKGLAVATAAVLLAALWFIRGARFQYYGALFGLVFTGCFVIVRAASMHHVDSFLGFRNAAPKMNWVLELGGIIVVAASALVADRPPAECVSEPCPEPDG